MKSKSICFASARTYIENVCEKIEATMNVTLRNWHMPMDPEYHPEVDDPPLLNKEQASQYRMLVGSTLWATTLGRYDILYCTNILARYNSIPREGRLKGMLRVFGYLSSYKKAMNVFDIREFTTETLDDLSHGWKELYPNAYEELPPDRVPKMKPLSMTAIYNASHVPCLVTRRSATGIVLLLNNFILLCTSKRQNTS